MHAMGLLLALWAAPFWQAPFWEARTPGEWTDREIERLLHDSPWAQVSDQIPLVAVYISTARPIQQAEAEQRRRSGHAAVNEDYQDFLRDDGGKHIVVTVPYPQWDVITDAAEVKRMEQESVMKIGRRKHRLTGHFPPTPSDPHLRLVFQRAATAADKSLVFDLYLPGTTIPYREVEFRIRDMVYRGKLEM